MRRLLPLLALLALGAVWRSVSFTSPDSGLTAYEAERSYDGRSWTPATLWRAAGDPAPVVPRARGLRESLLVSVSESRWIWEEAGGTRRRVRAVRGSARSDWSNLLLVSAAPDTEWFVERGPGALPPASERRIGPDPRVSLLPGDTASVRLTHQEVIQSRLAERILELFGLIGLRGRTYPTTAAAWPSGRPIDPGP